MSEIWLPVVGYEGHYAVSNLGRVRSLDRIIENPLPNGTIRNQRIKGRLLTPGVQKASGHRYVNLSRGNKRQRSRHVHRLVMDAFVGLKPAGQHTRHLNGDASDNRLANLAYGTPSQNGFDTVRHGRNVNANKTRCKRNHPLDEANVHLRKDGSRDCRACRRDRRLERMAVVV